MDIKKIFHPVNYLGFKTKRKIVIIESDDWGNEKLNNKNHFSRVLNENLINDSPYFKYDSLETNQDLEFLFNILSEFTDINGNHPKITGNFVVANPDYKAIKKDSYEKYHFTPTIELYSRDTRRDKVLNLYKNAIKEGIFMPQYHCREHLDVDRWMKALINDDELAIRAFNNNFVNMNFEQNTGKRKGISASFDFDQNFDQNMFTSYLEDMKTLFYDMFGFYSTTFIAPAYTWHQNLEQYLSRIGVKALQGNWKQTAPFPNDIQKPYRYIMHYIGQSNKYKQKYLVRNSSFEPSIFPYKDVVRECLDNIRIAFKFGKPATIGSHRINFIGSIEESNRTHNLKLFKELLSSIISKWPDVEFMSSDQLEYLINNPS